MGKRQPHRQNLELPHLTVFLRRMKRNSGKWIVAQAIFWLTLSLFYATGAYLLADHYILIDILTILNTLSALAGVFIIYYTIATTMTLILDYRGSHLGGWYASPLSTGRALGGALAAAGLMAAVPVLGLLTFVVTLEVGTESGTIAAAQLGGQLSTLLAWIAALLLKLPAFAMFSAVLLLLLRNHWFNRYAPRMLALTAALASGWMPFERCYSWLDVEHLFSSFAPELLPQIAKIAFDITGLLLILPLVVPCFAALARRPGAYRTTAVFVLGGLWLLFIITGPVLWLNGIENTFDNTLQPGANQVQRGLHDWLLVACGAFIIAVMATFYAAIKRWVNMWVATIPLGAVLFFGAAAGGWHLYDATRRGVWNLSLPRLQTLSHLERFTDLPFFVPVQLILSSWIPTVSAVGVEPRAFAATYLTTRNIDLAPYVWLFYIAAGLLWWYTAHNMLNAARHPQR